MGDKTKLTIKLLVAGLATTLVVALLFTNSFDFGKTEEEPPAEVPGQTYTVEVDGHNGPMTVDVTIDGDTITGVRVVEHEETEGLADPALTDIPAAIVSANSTDVDVVSGVTVTSDAIIEAVEQALALHGGGGATTGDTLQDGSYTVEDLTFGETGWQESLDIVVEGGVITDVTWTSLNAEGLNKLDDDEYQEIMTQTDGLGPQDFIPALEDALLEAQDPADVDVISGATGTALKFIEYAKLAVEAAKEGNTETIVVDNTPVTGELYTIEVEGHNGPMTVEVNIDGDTITRVEVVEHEETEGLADPALTDIPAAIVAANSANVDVVSGATITSDAIKEAVEIAQSQHGGNVNGGLQDGTYTVEDKVFGDTGWIETLEIVVENGEITDVTWTSLNAEGLNKLDDDEYQAIMTQTDGLGPQDFIPGLENALLEAQNPADVDVISGATGTALKFIEYAKLAVEAAKEGNTEVIVVNNGMQDGTYTVEDKEFGETGWIETLEIVVVDGEITDVTWTSLNEEGLNKLDDDEYQEIMTQTDGLGPQDFIPGLENALLEAQNPAGVDVISGATGTAEKFIEYAKLAVAAAKAGDTETIVVDNSPVTVEVDGNVYTVVVEAHNGPITVAVTIDGETITSVEVLEHEETEGLSDPAINDIPAAIVDANSTDVDVVSGVTVTSDAIIKAVDAAVAASQE